MTTTQTTAAPPISVWLFPSEAKQIFAGWDAELRSFVFGCLMPEKTVEITYWPGQAVEKDVPVPRTLLTQHLPILYGGVPFLGTEIGCQCPNCTAWNNFKHDPHTHPKPRTKKIHLGQNPQNQSQFGIYELFTHEGKTHFKRLALGNNKKSGNPIIQSIICWGWTSKRPKNLLESHNKFWGNFFSFSYTGKERRLDDPFGYPEYLHNYIKNSREIGQGYGDKEFVLSEFLQRLNPLLVDSEHHDGISVNFRGFPRKTPRLFWADRDWEGKWYLDGSPVEGVKIESNL